MPSAVELRDQLKEEIALLHGRFLNKWLPAQPQDSPEDYQHDVKAFCVLAHAVFEEFAEDIALNAVNYVKSAWLAKQFTPATAALLAAYQFKLNICEDEDTSQERIFDQVRKGLDECTSRHSIALSQNHGFSLKYLRGMLTPIGIDVPDDLKLMASLRELADARGSYAHSRAHRALYGQWKRAGRPMGPEKASETVLDCLELCEKILGRFEAATASAPKRTRRSKKPYFSVRLKLYRTTLV